MQYTVLAIGLLAIDGVSAVSLGRDTNDTLAMLNREVGNGKYKRPEEQEHFGLDSILGDFYTKTSSAYGGGNYGSFGHHGFGTPYSDKSHVTPIDTHSHFKYNGGYNLHPGKEGYGKKVEAPAFQWKAPEVRYPDPHPYSYSVDRPTLQFREVEHIAPADDYETPVPSYEHRYPEGYTNEYEGYGIGAYAGGRGDDHSHFSFDYDVQPHLHDGTPSNFTRAKRYQPRVDDFFVPVVVDPIPQANYNTGNPHHVPQATYVDKDLGARFYLIDDTLVPGESYTYTHEEKQEEVPSPLPIYYHEEESESEEEAPH